MTKKQINIESGDEQAPDAAAEAAAEAQQSEQQAATESSAAPDAGDVHAQLEAKTAALEKSEQMCSEYKDHLQRMKAEFENFKKRTERERLETTRYANEQFFRKLLPALDNLKRGCEYAEKSGADKDVFKGIEMVERQLVELVAEFGVKPFVSVGKPFDPNFHEPLYMVENAEVDENTVVSEMETGYMLHDRLLRVAKVAVSKKPAEEAPQQESAAE